MPISAPRKPVPRTRTMLRFTVFIVIALLTITASGLILLLITKQSAYDEMAVATDTTRTTTEAPLPFPVSVNPREKIITENPMVNSYLTTYLAYETVKPIRKSWLRQLTRSLAKKEWYQNLASPISRILIIWPGDRKEEVVDNFGDILHWDDAARKRFATLVTEAPPVLPDGTFFPGRYVTDKDAAPEAVAELLNERFNNEVLARYPTSIEEIIPLKDALVVASLLEREAYDFDQMREISGVIWNRLFTGMPLQLDATLQYVKGAKPEEATWWPQINPDDKYLKSTYNTYQHNGLPPSPIANPSAAAILAALNPTVTDCLFYFHDDDGMMHCSATYEEHVAKLKARYGQGQ